MTGRGSIRGIAMAGTDKFEELQLSDLSLEPLAGPRRDELPAAESRDEGERRDRRTRQRRRAPQEHGSPRGKERRMTMRFEGPIVAPAKDRRPRKGFDLLGPGKVE
jgi:hypothetical protein